LARIAILLIVWLGSGLAGPVIALRADDRPTSAGMEVGFNRDVRPILARHCFKCHGPDDRARKAHLRLDRPEDALKAADSGLSAIIPGRPEDSELVTRILAEDEGQRMPPPHAKLPLADEDKRILQRWIAQGAKYEEHWAFRRPSRPVVPVVKDREWPRSRGPETFAGGRSDRADPPRLARPDRPAPHARGG
jgi:hypothetical protein